MKELVSKLTGADQLAPYVRKNSQYIQLESGDIYFYKSLLDGWYDGLRGDLSGLWVARTRHSLESSDSIICELVDKCAPSNGHLSFPCALASEGDCISAFLEYGIGVAYPILYARVLLLMLDEFADGLDKLSMQIGARTRRPPRDLSMWANNWAKHRLKLLTTHHPEEYMADQFKDQREELWAGSGDVRFIKNGVERVRQRLSPSDIAKLTCENAGEDQLSAHSGRYCVIVPPMNHFVTQLIEYYEWFVSECLQRPDALQKFAVGWEHIKE